MAFIKFPLSILLLLLLTSCAKVNYLYHQSFGQMKVFTKSKSNKKLLESVRTPEEIKDKIRYIEELKSYFYKYWNEKTTPTYSRTTVLDQKAVTYLVITSPFKEIKADKECFPFMGCFPYLGFFNLNHAKEYAKEKEELGKYSYIRPVYAYSTLGYFDDPILSSFFIYDEFDLAELIFHELFHTIFFIKNQVELNENLANYFGKEMAIEYFKLKGKNHHVGIEKEEKSKELRKLIVVLTNKYKKLLKQKAPQSRADSDKLLDNFLKTEFFPRVESKCESLKVKKCFALKRKWNNASLAAYLTYENKADRIGKKRVANGQTLKEFFAYIRKTTENFEGEEKELAKALFD